LHRWAPIAEGSGNTKLFVCPFHKWVYDLDGQLVATPFMEQAENFDMAACKLPEFRSHVVPGLGFIFVNISGDAPPIGSKLDSFIDTYGNWKVEELVLASHSVSEFDFNWKIQIETAMECYHHIGAHATTFEPIQPARLSSCDDSKEGWTVCHSPYKEDLGDEAYTLGMVACPDLTPEQRKTCDYVLIYPNLFLVMRSEVITVMPVLPISAKKCMTTSARLVRPETLAEEGMLQRSTDSRKEFMVKITAEDVGINIQQQRTLTTSRYLRPGRLSHLETTVWDLANHIRSRVGDAAPRL
jgi:phenylpropionate dioxygenase-like ring-hydroxylating dioxygenase large terminal subunit